MFKGDRTRLRWIGALLAAAAIVAVSAPAASALTESSRYELANGCYGLRSQSLGRTVTGPLRLHATDLGRYLLYGRDRDYLTGGADNRVAPAPQPSERADWRVDVDGDAFKLTLPSADRALGVSGGDLVLVATPQAGRFTFEPAQGCAQFPEVDVSATGTPGSNPLAYAETRGFLDAHMHWMAYEFIGGSVHCGRPWHAWGVEQALVDCPDHGPGGAGAVLENALDNGERPTHDTVGWPTFKDWPHHASLTHEQSYYRWVERAWMGGLRLFVNLLVDNAVLCELYPLKRNSCNEMDGVRLQAVRIRQLERYVDAQNGGPGKGWFRIVENPFQARRVINQGKMAVVLGIEVSKLFDCGVQNDEPECTRAQVDREIDAAHRLGVRQLELVNKFDNAFTGVAGDSGNTGLVVNSGNRYETGRFWAMQSCPEQLGTHDNNQPAAPGVARDQLIGNGLQTFLPPGTTPVYPPPPHCNARGLTELGDHLLRRVMVKGMIFDPDHMSALARAQAMTLMESRNYPGVVSSHSWSTPDAEARIGNLGGVNAPMARTTTNFVKEWQRLRNFRNPKHFWGIGWGADMNGFAHQGPPRPNAAANPVRYPFKSFDGKVTFDKQRSGQRVYDINQDGMAHYGLFPDWVEDVRILGGNAAVEDLARGAEAYLQLWERAEGIAPQDCRAERGIFTRFGANRVRLNATPEQALRTGGQPRTRGRTWRWCVRGPNQRENPRATSAIVFTPQERVGLIGSTSPGHKAQHVGVGHPVRLLRGKATRLRRTNLYVRRLRNGARLVYGVRRGRVSFVAVATYTAARNPARLRGYLRLAGLG